MSEFITIAEIARRLNVPHATVRYWRDVFIEFIPFMGEGKKRRYKQESYDVLLYIAKRMNSGIATDNLKEELHQRFPVFIVNSKAKSQVVIARQQSDEISQNFALVEALKVIADQKTALDDLKRENANLCNKVDGLESKLATLEAELIHGKKRQREFEKQITSKIKGKK